MPPKTAQKRSRDSAGGGGAARLGKAPPASAPGAGRTHLSSVTSETVAVDGGDADSDVNPHRPKRSRRDDSNNKSGAGDEDTDVAMGEDDGEVDGGGGGAVGPASGGVAGLHKRSAASRPPTSREDSTDSSSGLEQAEEEEDAESSTQQAATKRGRRGTGGPRAPVHESDIIHHQQQQQQQQQQQHQQQPAPAMNGRQSTAFTATTGVLPGTVVGGRPPRSETSAPRGRGGAGSLSSPAPAPVPRGSAPTNTSVRQKGLRNGTTASHQRSSSHEAPLTTAATVDSPSREALSSVNIRQIAGLESPVTNDKSGPTSAVRRLDPPEDGTGGAGAGGEGDGRRVFGAITDAAEAGRFALMRIAKWRLDPSTALPAVQNATMRLMLLTALVMGARLAWAVTLKVVGMRPSPGIEEFSGSFSGSPPRFAGLRPREAALESARESAAFKDILGLSEKRSQRLAQMEIMTAKLQTSLEDLHRLRASFNDKMELVRVQAEDAEGLRGLPESPEESEAISLSQLAELKQMKESLHDLVVDTRDAVDHGQEWVDSEEAGLPQLILAVADGAAEEENAAEQRAWVNELSPSLTAKFLVMEEVWLAASALDEGEPGSKLRMEDANRLAQSVKEAYLAGAAGIDEEELKERVEEAATRQVELKWSRDAPAFAEVVGTVEEAERLVAKEIEIFTSGGTGMPDYASLRLGSSAVNGPLVLEGNRKGALTSPTLAKSILPWSDYFLHALRLPGYRWADGAAAALSLSNELGSCFAFHGGSGRLTVQLAPHPGFTRMVGRVKVTHVSIEHARTRSAPSAEKSAPRVFRVLGWDRSPVKANTNGQVVNGSAVLEMRGAAVGDDGALRPYVLVERAEFLVGDGAPGVQTFAVSEESLMAAPAVGWVTLEVKSNHGGRWTCLYGFRVHGNPVGAET